MRKGEGGGRYLHTVFFRLGEADHVLREDLGHAAHPGGDDVEPRARGFEDGDAERLGEGGVQEDRASREDLDGHRISLGKGWDNRVLTESTSLCGIDPSSSIRS